MGILGSLLDSFTGKGAQKALSAGKQASDAALASGYNQALPDFNAAVSSFDSSVQSGQKNQKFYDDLQGLNGQQAQIAAQQVYQQDPYAQNALGQSENALTRLGNARGYGAGKFALAGQRVANDAYAGWKGTYATGAQNGLAAATGQSNALTNRGNLNYGYGATKAGQETNYGNAAAGASNIFAQNYLGLLGTVAGAMKPTPTVGGGSGGSGRA